MDFYAYKDDKTNKVESQKFFLISEQRKEIVKQRGDGKVAIIRLQLLKRRMNLIVVGKNSAELNLLADNNCALL